MYVMNEAKLLEVLAQIQGLKTKRDKLVAMHNDSIETLSKYLENNMAVSKVLKLEGPTATAYYRKSTEVKVTDWNAVINFVKEKGAMDIIQRRISPVALKKRIDAGEKIKGVTVSDKETFIIQSSKEKENDSPENG